MVQPPQAHIRHEVLIEEFWLALYFNKMNGKPLWKITRFIKGVDLNGQDPNEEGRGGGNMPAGVDDWAGRKWFVNRTSFCHYV